MTEQDVINAGKSAGKSQQEIQAAVEKFRQWESSQKQQIVSPVSVSTQPKKNVGMIDSLISHVKSAVSNPLETLKGAGKSVLETVVGLDELTAKYVPGVGKSREFLKSKTGYDTSLKSILPKESYTQQNEAQKVGGFIGDIAQLAVSPQIKAGGVLSKIGQYGLQSAAFQAAKAGEVSGETALAGATGGILGGIGAAIGNVFKKTPVSKQLIQAINPSKSPTKKGLYVEDNLERVFRDITSKGEKPTLDTAYESIQAGKKKLMNVIKEKSDPNMTFNTQKLAEEARKKLNIDERIISKTSKSEELNNALQILDNFSGITKTSINPLNEASLKINDIMKGNKLKVGITLPNDSNLKTFNKITQNLESITKLENINKTNASTVISSVKNFLSPFKKTNENAKVLLEKIDSIKSSKLLPEEKIQELSKFLKTTKTIGKLKETINQQYNLGTKNVLSNQSNFKKVLQDIYSVSKSKIPTGINENKTFEGFINKLKPFQESIPEAKQLISELKEIRKLGNNTKIIDNSISSTEELESLLQVFNRDLQATNVYKKFTPNYKSGDLVDDAKQAIVDVIREAQDKAFSKVPGEYKELKKLYSAYRSVEDPVLRAQIGSKVLKDQNLSQQITSPFAVANIIGGTLRAIAGDVSGASQAAQGASQIAISKFIRNQQSAETLFNDAISKLLKPQDKYSKIQEVLKNISKKGTKNAVPYISGNMWNQ